VVAIGRFTARRVRLDWSHNDDALEGLIHSICYGTWKPLDDKIINDFLILSERLRPAIWAVVELSGVSWVF